VASSTQMTYERGVLSVGRYVRVFSESKQHALPARLVSASRKGGEVHPKGHKGTVWLPWHQIHDWVSKNGGPAPTPGKR